VEDSPLHLIAKRPYNEQYFYADRGYDVEDVHEIVLWQGCIKHIQHKRKRIGPKPEGVIPGEKTFPARRWVGERTLAWLAKRRSVANRWCKKPRNWLAFVHLACVDIVLGLIYG